MTFRFHSPRVLAIALLTLALAIPSLAAGQKRRSVGAAAPPVMVKLSGTVVDAGNNRPVVFATVAGPDSGTTTDQNGKFEIEIRVGATLTVSRSGYQTVSRVVPANTTTIQIPMTGLPTIRLKTTTNREYELDTESSEFAYLVPFSGYVRSDSGKFCKPDGSEYKPNKSIIKRFIGPAVASTNEGCCKDGKPILKARLELKSGEQTDVFFADSCFGYEVDFIGRDHFGGDFVFLKFNDITEIVFP
jgi:hypothetical protein